MVCPHCELAHPTGTATCSRCGRALTRPDEEDTLGFDTGDVSPAASKAVPPPAVASSVLSPAPSPRPEAHTAIHFSGAFSLTLQPGTDFGPRYRIESLLGEGGMGTVYKATDKELGRTVALKLVRPEYAASPAAMARFRQELLLASKISHKNILRIHDLGDAGGMKFITMAYVEGQDLGRLLEAGRLPLDRVLGFARQLCSALDAAHSEEVVHRDLKPNNILVDKADNLFVMDFGLAKSFENDATMMTRTGQILGTPRYMAPEQVEAKRVDHRADIYALGLILYEMATGEIPFRAESTLQLMYQRVTEAPKDPRTVAPDVPEYLAKIILKCLEKDPVQRYQSTREILADIDAQSVPVLSAPVSAGAQTISIQLPKPTRRSWLAATGAVTLAVAVLLAIPSTRQRILHPGGAKTGGGPAIRHYMAVLPLKVVGDSETTQYLADGVVDSVSAKLSGLSDVYVASAGAVNGAISQGNPAKIAHALGVTLLVQGTVQSSANQIAVTISLDDLGKNGKNLFHQEFKGVRDDLLTLEDKVFDSLVSALEIKQSNEELARSSVRPTENISAYDLYLKGQNLSRGKSPNGPEEAAKLFEQAIQTDRRFALAYAALAEAQLKIWDKTKDSAWTQKALGAAQQADAINDNLPEVHFVLGSVDTQTGRTSEAIAELQRALQLAPNSDEALRRLGTAYTRAGRPQDAVNAYIKATEVNPYLWNNYNLLGAAYAAQGQNEKALAAFQRVTELEPDRANGWANIGIIYKQLSRWNDSIAMFKRAISLAPMSPLHYSNLGAAYLVLGQYADAVPLFQKAVDLAPNDVLYQRNLADAFRLMGQRDKAMAAYDKAIALAFNAYKVNPRDAKNLAQLATCYAKKGDDKRAMEFMGQATAIDPNDNSILFKQGIIHALAGRTSQALASLSDALHKGYSVQEAKSDPELKALRETPEFKKLLADLAQPASK
jgi:tetratricopeptide (TPR) repeat protein/TolB-like protein